MAGRILIVDDVATNRIVLKVKLVSACYDVLQAQDGHDALAVAEREQPDLILLDVMMPGLDGIGTCKLLKDNPATANIPVVMVTALDDSESRIQALEAGADDFMSKPIDDLTLLARVRSLLRARETDEELKLREGTCRALGFAEPVADFAMPARVALIADCQSTAIKWKSDLSAHLGGVIDIVAQDAALNWSDDRKPPDVFVISGNLSRPDEGLRLLSELRSRPLTRFASVVMVLDRAARQQAIIALDLGASDLIVEEFSPREFALRIKTQAKRKQQSDRLRNVVQDSLRLAAIDPLTGLYNRRYALSHLDHIAKRTLGTDRTFAVMMLDIDRFKAVNDNFGHPAGDSVLSEVAARLQANLRGVDLVARIGGEEFLAAMPDTDLAEARIAAERLRRIVKETPITIADGRQVSVTISIGVAMGAGSGPDACTDINTLIGKADAALYSSKNEGRNLVTFTPAA